MFKVFWGRHADTMQKPWYAHGMRSRGKQESEHSRANNVSTIREKKLNSSEKWWITRVESVIVNEKHRTQIYGTLLVSPPVRQAHYPASAIVHMHWRGWVT